MKDTLRTGTEYTHSYKVPENKTVPYLYPESELFEDMPRVFATGFLVGLCEWACMEALAPHLDEGEGSVGTRIDLSHTAPTPPGMTVTVTVTCAEVAGKRTVWEIEARDEMDAIAGGTHERYTIDVKRFSDKVAEKVGSRV